MRNERLTRRDDRSSPPSRFGLTTRAELELSRSAINRRVKRGTLVRRYPGVYSFGPGELSREAQWMAAVLACGERAILNHLSAAALFRVSRWPESTPHVLVPRRHRPIEGIVVHQSLGFDPRDAVVVDGIPVTTAARMLVDLTDALTPHQLTYVINEAAFRHRFNLEATRRAMARANGRHNLRVLDRALELFAQGSAGTKSRYEDAFLLLVQSSGLPEPLVNTELLGYEADFHWPGHRLVVEVDGNHSRPKDRRGDAARDGTLRAAGYTTLRFTGSQVEERPDEVLGRLRDTRRVSCAHA